MHSVLDDGMVVNFVILFKMYTSMYVLLYFRFIEAIIMYSDIAMQNNQNSALPPEIYTLYRFRGSVVTGCHNKKTQEVVDKVPREKKNEK